MCLHIYTCGEALEGDSQNFHIYLTWLWCYTIFIFPLYSFLPFLSLLGAVSTLVIIWENNTLKYFFNVYFFETKTEHERGRVRERGRHKIRNRLQAPRRRHSARHRARTHRPWDHDPRWSRTLNRLSHPGAPKQYLKSVSSKKNHALKNTSHVTCLCECTNHILFWEQFWYGARKNSFQ